ncbi:MAG: type IX secretion system sortase PorU [Rhodothermales bacterium]|nr:type IX secretion system sortase PorU [Rhodothermales bacterium]
MSLRTSIVILVLVFLCPPGTVDAQVRDVDSQVLSSNRELISFQATWNASLQASLDSIDSHILSGGDILRLAGGELDISHRVVLASNTSPFVRQSSATYDEVALPANRISDDALQLLEQVSNRIVSVGVVRKRPVAVVATPVLEYDAQRQILRRYSTVQLEVSKPASFTTSAKALGVSSNPHLAVERSVLADGTIFKIPVTGEGIYRVDRQLLTELGINPDAVEPNRVQIFSNQGSPLPDANARPRIPDLAEVASRIVGGGDGSFGSSDAVVFYLNGTTSWTYDSTGATWDHTVNPFDVANYVFIKIGTINARQVSLAAPEGVVSPQSITTVTGRYVNDFDVFMWSREHGSGHTWVSNPIRENGRLDVINEPGLPQLGTGTATFEVRTAISSNPRATVTFESGSTVLASVRAPFSILPNSQQPTAAGSTSRFDGSVTQGGSVTLSMALADQANDPQASIDWVRMFYPQRLVAVDEQVRFHTADASSDSEFLLSGFSASPIVLDITRPDSIFGVAVRTSGSNYAVDIAVGAEPVIRELVAYGPGAIQRLQSEGAIAVSNQNLHGLEGHPRFVIVTPAEFLESANRLANRRRAEGLDVQVVDIEHVYNEFSGGLVDMRAVRDYVRFLYDRAETEFELPRYLLLFGDGHFDFRNLRQLPEPENNWIPPYETVESFHPDRSYTSDDYFGLLDENEGVWVYRGFNVGSTEMVDIGIGRIPAQTVAEAASMVKKIEDYESPESYGPWRTKYTLVADDAFTGATGAIAESDLHMQNVDSVAELVENELAPQINQKKIYAESFNRVFLNEFRIPDAKAEILKSLIDGTLIFNYSGHGGPVGLAQEDLFTKQDAEELTNGDKLAIFVTATCSFGWWDIDDATSAAEALLKNPDGGAVAMLTTVRQVYTAGDTTTLNPGLNRALNRELFRRDENGLPVRLGDAMLATKGTPVGLIGNSRKFSLLGDPTMRLGLPRGGASVEALNGTPIDTLAGQLKALDRVVLSGAIRDVQGNVDAGFSGTATVTVFDAERRILVKYPRYMPTPDYGVREDLIWRGDVGVNAGRFEATFVVPKDISYSNLSGRISVYASGPQDAAGYSENIFVGGTSDNPPNDIAGPEVRLFLNDTTFVSGGLTNPDPQLIVKVFDESGINTVGAGVGHELLLTVNGDEINSTDISSGFQSEPNSYQKGTVTWALSDLPDGPGDLGVRIWDVLNNSTEAVLDYTVTASERLAIRNVYNYPNPMSSRTRFVFEHNQVPGTQADVLIRVYTIDGRPVRTIESADALPEGVLTGGPVSVPWDGLDEDLDRLATGIYLYKVRVEVDSPEGGRQVAEQIEKIALIR